VVVPFFVLLVLFSDVFNSHQLIFILLSFSHRIYSILSSTKSIRVYFFKNQFDTNFLNILGKYSFHLEYTILLFKLFINFGKISFLIVLLSFKKIFIYNLQNKKNNQDDITQSVSPKIKDKNSCSG
jgi:hypothetical protein